MAICEFVRDLSHLPVPGRTLAQLINRQLCLVPRLTTPQETR